MSFFQSTPLKDLVLYKPPVFRDDRGYFTESFNANKFKEMGLNSHFVQDNRSFSKKGTLRGLHFQMGEWAQAKLVGVLSGKVFDVAVDIRQSSPTCGQSFGVTLDASEDPVFMYVPRGFAHGFLVMSETAEFFYKVDNFYNKESEKGISYNDPDLNIQWPEVDAPITLSEKDRVLPKFKDFMVEFGGHVL